LRDWEVWEDDRTRAFLITAAVVLGVIGIGVAAESASVSNEPQGCIARTHGALCVTGVVRSAFSPSSVSYLDTTYSVATSAGPTDGFVAGARCQPRCEGVLAITTDAGARWSTESTGAVIGADLSFPTASEGFLLGSRTRPQQFGPVTASCQDGLDPPACEVLLRTSDAGRHWSQIGLSLPPVWSMTFLSARLGLVAVDICGKSGTGESVPPPPCAGRIERTRDAGDHWSTVLDSSAPIVALASEGTTVWAIEARTASFARSPSTNWLRVLRSENGGTSWSRLGAVRDAMNMVPTDLAAQLVFSSSKVGAIALFSPSTCMMHGCGLDQLFATADGGATWSPAFLPGGHDGCGDAIGAIAAAPGGRIIAGVGASGQCPVEKDRVVETDDGGRNWRTLRSYAFGPDPVSMALPSADGWAAGASGIFRTVDGGAHWTQVSPPLSPANGIEFVSPRAGFGLGTVSDPSALLATNDGGRTWRELSSVGSELLQVAFTDALHGWALVATAPPGGGTEAIMTTADGGRRWRAAAALPASVASGPTAIGLQASSARGAQLVIPGSASPVAPPCSTIESTPNLLVTTSDGGRSWRVTKLPGPMGPVIASSSAGPMDRWLVSGNSGAGCRAVVASTLDADRSWSVVGSAPVVGGNAPATPGYGLDVLSATSAWLWLSRFGDASGEPAQLVLATGLLHTVDGGRTWTRYVLPEQVLRVRAADSQWPLGLGPAAVQFLPQQPAVGWMLTGLGPDEGPATVEPDLWQTTDGGQHWVALG
jgi:photosystem II stability/assembly factor-like uncharacterized protein